MSCGCLKKLDEPKYWGWIVVLADFICLFLTVGLLRSTGIFYDEWMEYFEESSSVISTLGTLTSVITAISSPVATTLASRFGTRPVVMAGGVVSFIGFFSSAFAPNAYVLFATFGLMIGLGFGLSCSPMFSIPVYYFEDNPNLVLGIAASGLSIGSMVLPIVLQYLTEAYSWKGAAIVMSAVSLNLCVCGAVVRPIQPQSQKGSDDIALSSNGPGGDFTPDTPKEEVKDLKKSFRSLFTNIAFMLIKVETVFFSTGLHIIETHLKAAVIEIGDVTDRKGTYALTVMGGGALVGSLGISLLLYKFPMINSLAVMITMTTTSGIGMILLPLISKEYYVILIVVAVIGTTMNPQVFLLQVVYKDIVGLEDVILAFGMFQAFMGIGGLIGPPLAGYAYDMTGDYSNSLYIAGAAGILANIWIIQTCISSLRKRTVYEVEAESHGRGSKYTEKA